MWSRRMSQLQITWTVSGGLVCSVRFTPGKMGATATMLHTRPLSTSRCKPSNRSSYLLSGVEALSMYWIELRVVHVLLR